MPHPDRILVIDDDSVVLELVSTLARTMGLACSALTDAAALSSPEAHETAVILLDLMMPGMDGIEVLRLLSERRSKARILLMSGMDKRILETAEKLAQSLGLPVVGHLQKPFPLRELKHMLESASGAEAPQTSVEEPAPAVSDEQVRRAIEGREIVNHYQPQVSLATGEVIGVEALARWQHPEIGLLAPASFLSRVAALGLTDQLCWIAAEGALADLRHIFHGGEHPRVSLNVSMLSLGDLSFPDALTDLARRHAYPIEKIAVEITESGLIHELSRTLDVLTRLRMRNFQLSIDDFGTGYAMMQQLQNVPATELKIDKSIVEKMHVNDSDRVMVEKIIEMGHELKMKVIAEGVATREQFDLLRLKGCDGAQGYLIGRPLSLPDLERWLGSRSPRPS